MTLQYFVEAFARSLTAAEERKAELDRLVASAEVSSAPAWKSTAVVDIQTCLRTMLSFDGVIQVQLKTCTEKLQASDRRAQGALEKKQGLEAKLMSAKAEHDRARQRADLPTMGQASLFAQQCTPVPASDLLLSTAINGYGCMQAHDTTTPGSDRSADASPPSSPAKYVCLLIVA